MRAFCFNTGRNRAKQHSSIVDWSWLNKNVKDRLLNCFVLSIFTVVNFTTPAPSELIRPLSGWAYVTEAHVRQIPGLSVS